jgi:hypothetical protein
MRGRLRNAASLTGKTAAGRILATCTDAMMAHQLSNRVDRRSDEPNVMSD